MIIFMASKKYLFKISVLTSNRTQHLTIRIKCLLILFIEIGLIPVYRRNKTEPINIKCRVIDC
jgi:hypothetical protein